MNRFTMMICAVLIAAISWAGPLTAAPAEKTAICHFPGHWAYLGTPPNGYAVFDWIIQGDGTGCLDSGGKVIEVSDKALMGHQVNANTLFPLELFGQRCIICHFPGQHQDPLADAVITRGAGGYCFENGGMVIVTACSALAGHKPWCKAGTWICDDL